MNYKVLGVMLQSARKTAGYSQKDVADWFGSSPQNISSWERGNSKIDIDSLLLLCDRYGLDFVAVLKEASIIRPATSEGSGEDDLSNEAQEVAEAYKNAERHVQFCVRKLLNVDLNDDEIRVAAYRSKKPHPFTGPDTDVEI